MIQKVKRMIDRKELIDLLRSSQSHTMIEAADEITRLCKYEKLVHFIANDYHELSHDKAQWQRDDWKKRCKKVIEEYYEDTDSIRPSS